MSEAPAHADVHAHADAYTQTQPPLADGSRAPVVVRSVAVSVVGLLLAGAAWLIWNRGEAMIVDLATLGGGMFCF